MELVVGERFYLDGFSGLNMGVDAYRNGSYKYTFNFEKFFATPSANPSTNYYGLLTDGTPSQVYPDSMLKLFKMVVEGPYKAYIEPLVYEGDDPDTNTVIRAIAGSRVPPMVVGWADASDQVLEGSTVELVITRSRYHEYPQETFGLNVLPSSTATPAEYSIPTDITFAEEGASATVIFTANADAANDTNFVDIQLDPPEGKTVEWGNQVIRVHIQDTSPVRGCTDPSATNYNPNATIDDGSCTYPQIQGCTDPMANNYNPNANVDDGSCTYNDPGDSSCIITDDLYEQRFWFKVFFINPPNGESLHERGLIQYEWDFESLPTFGEVSFEGFADNKRVGKTKFSWIASPEHSEDRVEFEVKATAKDLRFNQLDITDSDTEVVSFLVPCVNDGNTPTFIINDVRLKEPESGTREMVFTVLASEPVTGKPITIDYCTSDVTASSQSESIEVQHAAYDLAGQPFISYLEHQNIRACFDASFPKYYNGMLGTDRSVKAKQLYNNALNWLDHKSYPNKVLIIGDREDNEYNVKNAYGSGFRGVLDTWATEAGYTPEIYYLSEFKNNNPTINDFKQYSVVVYMSTYFSDTPQITEAWVTALEGAVRQGVGLLVVTDHTDPSGESFAINGNKIVRRFFAEFSGKIDRTLGTDFDAVRDQYGDHPLIQGITGTMAGDSTEGKVETNNAVFAPDYVNECGTVTFLEGNQTKEISITINTDTIYEPDETFEVTLSNISRGYLGKNVGIGTIEEFIVPEIKVELDSQGAKKQVFVGRDTSGSTDAEEVTVNGGSATRRQLMEQILMDYAIASCAIPTHTGHGVDGCTSAGGRVDYQGIPGATDSQTVAYLQSVVSKIDSDTDEISVLVMNDSSDSVSSIDPNSAWSNELASIPRNIPVTLTFIRVCSQANAEQTSGPYYDAAVWFQAIIANAPPNVIGYFKTFYDYDTGGDGELNLILSSTLENDYKAWCTARPDVTIIVSSSDEDGAKEKAEEIITCP